MNDSKRYYLERTKFFAYNAILHLYHVYELNQTLVEPVTLTKKVDEYFHCVLDKNAVLAALRAPAPFTIAEPMRESGSRQEFKLALNEIEAMHRQLSRYPDGILSRLAALRSDWHPKMDASRTLLAGGKLELGRVAPPRQQFSSRISQALMGDPGWEMVNLLYPATLQCLPQRISHEFL